MTVEPRHSLRSVRSVVLAAMGVAALVLAALAASGRALPATAAPLAPAVGTISGTVRGLNGPAIDGRLVEIVNVSTGERRRAVTDRAGAFAIRVTPGAYRVELILRDGERLTSEPRTLDVSRRDPAAHADLVVGNTRLSRPRGPAYQTATGLGSPVA